MRNSNSSRVVERAILVLILAATGIREYTVTIEAVSEPVAVVTPNILPDGQVGEPYMAQLGIEIHD